MSSGRIYSTARNVFNYKTPQVSSSKNPNRSIIVFDGVSGTYIRSTSAFIDGNGNITTLGSIYAGTIDVGDNIQAAQIQTSHIIDDSGTGILVESLNIKDSTITSNTAGKHLRIILGTNDFNLTANDINLTSEYSNVNITAPSGGVSIASPKLRVPLYMYNPTSGGVITLAVGDNTGVISGGSLKLYSNTSSDNPGAVGIVFDTRSANPGFFIDGYNGTSNTRFVTVSSSGTLTLSQALAIGEISCTSISAGSATISGSLSSGPITSTGSLRLGSNTVACGAITSSGMLSLGSNNIACGSIRSTGALIMGFNTITCGAITSTGTLNLGNNTIGCGAITSTGTLNLGNNTIGCGAITSTGALSLGSNTIGCGALACGAITSTGSLSLGSNTIGCGALACGAITSTGSLNLGSNTVDCGAISCGAITSTGSLSLGSNTIGCGAISCGAITSTGALDLGSNTIACGAITSTGSLSLGNNAIGCGAITSSGALNLGSNTVACGAITSSGALNLGSNGIICGDVGIGGLVYNAVTNAKMQIGKSTNNGTIVGAYLEMYGNNTGNTANSGMARFVTDSRSNAVNAFDVLKFDGSTYNAILRLTSGGILTVPGLTVGTSTVTLGGNFSTGSTFSTSGTFATGGNFATGNTFSTTGTFATGDTFSTSGTFATGSTFSTSGTFATGGNFSTGSTFSTSGTFATGGNFSTAAAVTIAGAYASKLNITADTEVTLPTTGVLATLEGEETFKNKTISDSTNSINAAVIKSGTLDAARLPAFTGGDVTTSAAGSANLTIGTSRVTLGMMANLTTKTLIGNDNNADGTPKALDAAAVKTILALTQADIGGLKTSSDVEFKSIKAVFKSQLGDLQIGNLLFNPGAAVDTKLTVGCCTSSAGPTGAIAEFHSNTFSNVEKSGAIAIITDSRGTSSTNALLLDSYNGTAYSRLLTLTKTGGLTISGTLTTGSSILSLAGNLTTSGAYAVTLTATGATGVTLPTSGTLATLIGTETFTNKTMTDSTNKINASIITDGELPIARLPRFTGGDVTTLASGSVDLVIGTGKVTLTKMANLGAGTLLGNNTASSATPAALDVGTVRTLLGLATNSAVQFQSVTASLNGNANTASTVGTTNLGKTGNVSPTTVSTKANFVALPVGFSGILAAVATAGAMPNTSANFYLNKMANRDYDGGWYGLCTDWNSGPLYWGRAVDTAAGFATWNEIVDTSSTQNINNKTCGSGFTFGGTGADKIKITNNIIEPSSSNANSDVILRSKGTGVIKLESDIYVTKNIDSTESVNITKGLTVNGLTTFDCSVTFTIVKTSISYAVTELDTTIPKECVIISRTDISTPSGNIIITLPPLANLPGRLIIIKNMAVTGRQTVINTSSSEKIDNQATSYTMTTSYQVVRLIALSGVSWLII